MFHGTFSWVLEPLLPLRIKFASAEHIVHSTALVPARTQENPCADAQGVLHLLGFHILMVARRNPAPIEALAHYLEGFNHPIHCMFDGELPIFCRTHPQNPNLIRKPPGPMLATLDGLQGPARRGWRSTSVTMFCQNAFFCGKSGTPPISINVMISIILENSIISKHEKHNPNWKTLFSAI